MREPIVYIVDDDPGLNASLAALFRSVGLKTELFQHPQPFLDLSQIHRPACLLLDVRLPGINGLDVLEQVRKMGWTMPVVMISGHADVVMAVRAMHAGARDFLEKPVNDTILLQLVQHWTRWDKQNYSCELICDSIRAKLETLTEREQSVLQCMLRGLPNKVAARELKLSVKAVEGHRINILHKMGAQSPVELVQMVCICPKSAHTPMNCARGRCDGRARSAGFADEAKDLGFARGGKPDATPAFGGWRWAERFTGPARARADPAAPQPDRTVRALSKT